MTKQAGNNPQGTANIADDRVLATSALSGCEIVKCQHYKDGKCNDFLSTAIIFDDFDKHNFLPEYARYSPLESFCTHYRPTVYRGIIYVVDFAVNHFFNTFFPVYNSMK